MALQMEQIRLLNMDENSDASDHQDDASVGEQFAIIPGVSGESLESLRFSNARPPPRRYSREKFCSLSRGQTFLMTAALVCGTLAVGYALLQYTKHGSRLSVFDQPRAAALKNSPMWLEKLDTPPDFARCPKEYADKPVLLVLSMDGFAAHFMNRSEYIALLGEKGVRAEHMRPVFPSNTFPNHYSIVTGLHPESHGIVDNSFVDENGTDSFVVYTASKYNPKWWKGTPIWQYAQEQGLRVYAHYWPGSEVLINNVRPTRYLNFSMAETVEQRAESLLAGLRLPKDQRPHLILNYYQEPDNAVHYSGLASPEVDKAIASADQLLNLVIEGLVRANLTDCVNVIVLSDHGVSECTRSIQPTQKLKDKFGEKYDKMWISNSSVVSTRINPSPAGVSVKEAADALACDSSQSSYQVYSPDTDDLPVRLHYRNNPRISPILLLSNTSTAMYALNTNYSCKNFWAVHGWDTIYSRMQAIFVAFGPSFKTKTTVEPFANIQLFGLFADLLGIKVGPHNGTEGSLRHLLSGWKNVSVKHRPAADTYLSTASQEDTKLIAYKFCSTQPATENECPLLAEPDPAVVRKFDEFIPPHMQNYTNVRLLLERECVTGYSEDLALALWTTFRVDSKFSPSPTSNISCYLRDSREREVVLGDCDSKRRLPADDFQLSSISGTGYPVSTDLLYLNTAFRVGIWSRFWKRVADWASHSVAGRIQATVGPVFDSKAPFGFADPLESPNIGTSKRVPTHLFVILTRKIAQPVCQEESCSVDVIAFVFPNRDVKFCQQDQFWLLTRTATVRDVELLTSMEFFTELPSNEAARLRTRVNDKLWDMDRML